MGPMVVNNSKKDERQVTTRVSQSRSEAGNAEGLARGSSANKVRVFDVPLMVLRHVAQVGHFWMSVLHYFDREAFDLAGSYTRPAMRLERFVGRAYSVAHRQVLHRVVRFDGYKWISTLGLCLSTYLVMVPRRMRRSLRRMPAACKASEQPFSAFA